MWSERVYIPVYKYGRCGKKRYNYTNIVGVVKTESNGQIKGRGQIRYWYMQLWVLSGQVQRSFWVWSVQTRGGLYVPGILHTRYFTILHKCPWVLFIHVFQSQMLFVGVVMTSSVPSPLTQVKERLCGNGEGLRRDQPSRQRLCDGRSTGDVVAGSLF